MSTEKHHRKLTESLAVAVHQVKNPIYVLKGYLEVLLSEDIGELNSKQKEYLSDSLENVSRATSIINDLLRILEIEEKEYKVKSEEVDLVKVVAQVVENYTFLAKATNVDIHFNYAQKIPLVSTDSKKIYYVVENLVSNAIKYKGQGRGVVEIYIDKKEEDVLFSIKDQGVGIPEDIAENLFSKFFRTEKAVEIDPTGLGLGLYISRAIVNLSGGEIWFENNKEGGTTFYFTLPKSK